MGGRKEEWMPRYCAISQIRLELRKRRVKGKFLTCIDTQLLPSTGITYCFTFKITLKITVRISSICNIEQNLFNFSNKKPRSQWLLPVIQFLNDTVRDLGSFWFYSVIVHKLPISQWLREGCCSPRHHIQCSKQKEDEGTKILSL